MSNQLYDNPIGQIAFVVNNVEKAKEEFAEKFGFEEIPGTGDLGDPEVGQTMYKGMYCPDIQCKIANFSLGSFSVEIMEPNEVPSAWRDWLDKHGISGYLRYRFLHGRVTSDLSGSIWVIKL